MKSLFISLIVLFTTHTINAQIAYWSKQISGTANNLYSVFFTNADTGYAVGDNGAILKTTNGGTSWSVQNLGITNNLYSVYFINTNIGYAVGDAILKTTNGGDTWSIQNTPDINDPLFSVCFTDSITGYAVGDEGTILKTINGGANWVKQNSPVSIYPLYSVYFTDSMTGCAVGGGGTILKTTNGGASWTIQHSGTASAYLFSVYFTDSLIGYAVGSTILKTIDGGNNWSVKNLADTFAWLYSVYFTDSMTGIAVGGIDWFSSSKMDMPFTGYATIIKTYDGGLTWNYLKSDIIEILNSVCFTINSIGYAVGNSGTIIKTTNGGGNSIKPSYCSSFIKAYPNPATDKLYIEIPQTFIESQLSLYNTTGQEIINQQISDTNTELNISILQRGVYLLKFTNTISSGVIEIIKE